MVEKRQKTQLEADIARALATRAEARTVNPEQGIAKWLLMTGSALAILQSPTSNALSLGELRVDSAIGEPLVAATTVRLGEGERLSNKCMSAPAGSGGDITRPAGVNVTTVEATGPGEYPVRLSTRTPLYEPMYEIQLQVECTGSIALSKNYVVLLNLPVATLAPQTQSRENAGEAVAQPTEPTVPAARRSQVRALDTSSAPIAAGSLYRVRSGDTLSTVAERVADRPAGSLWNVAELLFSANPDAFVRNDRDLLKLGAVLYIPEAGTLAGALPPARESMATLPSAAAAQAAPAQPEPAAPLANTADTTAVAASALSIAPDVVATPTAEPGAVVAAPIDMAEIEDNVEGAPDRPAAQNAERAAEPPPQVSAQPQNFPSELNPIIAVLAGMLLGALLAIAILGRSLLGSLLGRRRGEAAVPLATVEPTPEPVSNETPQDTQRLRREPADPLSYTRAGIDVELTPAADTSVDLDLSDGLVPVDDNATTSPHPPRISLHDQDNEFANMLDELAATGEVSALYAQPEKETANSTIRDLFSSLEPPHTGDNDDTSLMPEESATSTAKMPHMDTDELTAQDLQTLSKRMSDDDDDERLSATLTQALQLLEKDYEDELSTSQRLNRDDIDAAFAKRAGKSS